MPTSNIGDIMRQHVYNSQPMALPSINFLHIKFSEILPGNEYIGQGHYSKVKGQFKVELQHCTPIPHLMSLKSINFLHLYSLQDTA